ncbi:phytanoyl-CoA dioxygenase family protein [Paenibacillus cymbidii]|uniref:phytanoyl-CoA dioxygenase family protein n=1 Tax=Paenibacillus cymbidii TaxID=1639034 RepID=UPI0010801508|nr:phytanoyl-CoA dioxygenase family protein [Paenibacillus cymbidii]
MAATTRLTPEQVQFYADNGYLNGLAPVYTGEEVAELQEGYRRIVSLLYDGELPSDIMNWHLTSKWLYDICANPRILDLVEGILGPNFYMARTEFITKSPKSDKIVPWHQDSYYWSTEKSKTVTVWLAVSDVTEQNGAMKVIPGTHNAGIIQHRIAGKDSILSFELERGSFNENDAIALVNPAGCISMHDDAIIHGSGPNVSDGWRIGFVIRYSQTGVYWDPKHYPDFRMYMMRGVDEFKRHEQGEVPIERFARPEESNRRIRKTEASN